MRAFATLLALVVAGGVAAQEPPEVHQGGASIAPAGGDLAGFAPIEKVWPEVRTEWANGRQFSIHALVSKGRAHAFRINGDAKPSVAEPFLSALRQWRFRMPGDGSSPVQYDVVVQARDGRFVVVKTEAGLL